MLYVTMDTNSVSIAFWVFSSTPTLGGASENTQFGGLDDPTSRALKRNGTRGEIGIGPKCDHSAFLKIDQIYHLDHH